MREGWPRSPLSEILKAWNKTILFFNIKCTSYDNSVENQCPQKQNYCTEALVDFVERSYT